jgi:Peptidase A4 family
MHARSTLVIAAMLTLGLGAAPAGGAAEPALAVAPARAGAVLASLSASADPVVHAATPAGVRGAGGLGWYSSNWAGYALAGGPYRSVSGQWTVPSVTPTGRSSYSAQWVGVDGVSSAALIQAGTQANFVNGTPHYSAWWEILPAPAVSIRTMTVRPGDVVSVTIARVSPGRWRISLKDSRSGSFTTTRGYAGPGASAEWIVEAPFIGWRIPQLAAHAPVVFDNAMVNGGMAHLSIGDAGAMIRRGVLVDTPSAPDADGNGFAVAEQATQPDRPIQT